MTEEGAIQLLQAYDLSGDLIFAAVGQLQFEVMQYRLKDEYGVETVLTPSLSVQCLAVLETFPHLQKQRIRSLFEIAGTSNGAIRRTMGKAIRGIKQNPDHQLVDSSMILTG